MKKKVKRYQEGGEAEMKKRGLESSKDEKVGFLERLKMGNIDDPRSEAYRRFGAGRGRMDIEAQTPVPEMSSDYSGRGATTLSETKELPKPAEATMSMTERLRAASPGSNIRRMDGEGGGYTSPVTEEFKEEVKVKPKKSKLQVQNQMAKRMARGYAKAAEAGLKKGGKVSSASSRADGIAQRGKTRGRIC